MLEPIWPALIAAWVKELQRLREVLGDFNDLCELEVADQRSSLALIQGQEPNDGAAAAGRAPRRAARQGQAAGATAVRRGTAGICHSHDGDVGELVRRSLGFQREIGQPRKKPAPADEADTGFRNHCEEGLLAHFAGLAATYSPAP